MTTTPPDDHTDSTPPRPRYGEYAPTSAPATAAPSAAPTAAPTGPPAPPSAAPHPYTGYQSPLGYGAGGYGFPGPVAEASRPKTVGVIAFVVGLVLLVGAPIASAFVAQGFAPLLRYSTDGTFDVSDIPADELGSFAGVSFAMFAVLGLGTLLGLWALIQGIVATATRRGRAFGVLAIVVSVLTPIVCVITFYTVVFTTVPELLQR